MYSTARKIHLIEEVLKVKDDAVLIQIEKILNSYSNSEIKSGIDDFVGIISQSEAIEMKHAIAETCENIDNNVWK
jgi:hypothetical protein